MSIIIWPHSGHASECESNQWILSNHTECLVIIFVSIVNNMPLVLYIKSLKNIFQDICEFFSNIHQLMLGNHTTKLPFHINDNLDLWNFSKILHNVFISDMQLFVTNMQFLLWSCHYPGKCVPCEQKVTWYKAKNCISATKSCILTLKNCSSVQKNYISAKK